ncbi:MAG: calcium/sodium antiporter [Nanoarchaeota archaeon]|nr:calcium/sodium antiporter [Nanoarchaeota archaeon]
MSIGPEFLIFGIALAVLVKGSDFFVSSASKLAKYFGVSDFVIGLTVVAIGTSLPEFASAIVAALSNNTGLIIGNIVGANITNICLNLGLSAVIVVLEIKKTMFRRDGLFLIIISLLFLIFALDKTVSRLEGIILYTLFMFYISYLFRFQPSKGKFGFKKYFKNFNGEFLLRFIRPNTYKEILLTGFKFISPRKSLTPEEENFFSMFKNVTLLIIGGLAIYYSAEYLVPSAVNIAHYFKVPEDIIGLVLISIGTTLPELSVSLTAAKKGLSNILIGNVLGSNIANILLIGGVSAIIHPLAINTISLYYTIPFMILMTFMLLSFIRAHWILKMFQGLILLIFYLLFIISLVLFFL